MLKAFFIFVISAVLLSFSLSYGEIYKSVDKNGVVLFTNVPPVTSHKKKIKVNKFNSYDSSSYYDQIINNKSSKYSVDASLIKAIITVESNWRKNAVSNKGAMGLMQLMPSTAKDMGVINPFDPEENIDGGTRYLRFLLDMFNDLPLAVAAYNAGPGTVTDYGGVPAFPETEDYVNKVFSLYEGKTNWVTNRNTNRDDTGRAITDKDIPAKIYKVTMDDGTLFFTNIPSEYKSLKLSKF
ncbi:MAG: lytic transglycosylase domain-containing protein [Thermodesulfovibrionia bacterium]|nr:lytic transglycosylase domain-containing protein [Thermodesulfovibrionia bacterium]